MTDPTWRKSSFSATESACVELAWDGSTPLVRDTKGAPDKILRLPDQAWRTFLSITTR
ncbi:DUF397 domain-containing protein [Actinokineospora sp. 24-640]